MLILHKKIKSVIICSKNIEINRFLYCKTLKIIIQEAADTIGGD